MKILRIVVAGGTLAYLFMRIPLAGVIEAMAGADPTPLIGAWVVTLGLQWAVAVRLRRLVTAQGIQWSTMEVFEINLATLFYGLFLPGGNFTGIAIRFHRLSGEDRAFAGVGVGLFIDRILATITLCVVGVAFWLVERPEGSFAVLGLLVMGLVAALGLAFSLLRPNGQSWALANRWFGERFRSLRLALDRASDLPRRALAEAVALSFVAHLLGVIAYWALVSALGIDLSLITVGWVRSAVILATMVPVSVSGLGLREGAVLMLLDRYGVPGEAALALSVLVFGVTVLGVGLVGGLFEAKRLL